MTLIEVLAGLAILASLLGAILLARSQHARQTVTAQRRLEAVQAADILLTGWWRDPQQFPRSASGPVTGNERLTWRTEIVNAPAASKLQVQIVRLEIRSPSDPGKPLVRVELVLPDETNEDKPGVHAH
ncbi:MAG TPA: hypothetical protein VLH09_02730 [Bryobacteraceae bacterium]|nr:hypothetical protein [Bryobacteraceae bacterium]